MWLKTLTVFSVPTSTESFRYCLIRPINTTTKLLKRPSFIGMFTPWVCQDYDFTILWRLHEKCSSLICVNSNFRNCMVFKRCGTCSRKNLSCKLHATLSCSNRYRETTMPMLKLMHTFNTIWALFSQTVSLNNGLNIFEVSSSTSCNNFASRIEWS